MNQEQNRKAEVIFTDRHSIVEPQWSNSSSRSALIEMRQEFQRQRNLVVSLDNPINIGHNTKHSKLELKCYRALRRNQNILSELGKTLRLRYEAETNIPVKKDKKEKTHEATTTKKYEYFQSNISGSSLSEISHDTELSAYGTDLSKSESSNLSEDMNVTYFENCENFDQHLSESVSELNDNKFDGNDRSEHEQVENKSDVHPHPTQIKDRSEHEQVENTSDVHPHPTQIKDRSEHEQVENKSDVHPIQKMINSFGALVSEVKEISEMGLSTVQSKESFDTESSSYSRDDESMMDNISLRVKLSGFDSEKHLESRSLKRCNKSLIDVFMAELTDMESDQIIIKVHAVQRPYDIVDSMVECGIHEQIPIQGAPEVIVVGEVVSHTNPDWPVSYEDRVLALLPEKCYSTTYVAIPVNRAIKIEKYIEPWQQISIVLSYLPALQALKMVPFDVSDQRVLICSGLGPVNQALIHLCSKFNAEKVFVACDENYVGDVQNLGAIPVGPRHTDWGPQLFESIDIVFDAIGENKFITSKASMAEDGYMVVTGFKEFREDKSKFISRFLLQQEIDVRLKTSNISRYDFMQSFGSDRHRFQRDFQMIERMIVGGMLPIIGNVQDMCTRESTEIESDSSCRIRSHLDGSVICSISTNFVHGTDLRKSCCLR